MNNISNSWITKYKIAHRGIHDENTPENTIAAFENCIQKNYAIELDLRQIVDDTIIVFHDETLNRLTKLEGYSQKLTKEDLASVQINDTKHTIPTLQDVLETIAGKVPLLLEIKNNFIDGKFEQKLLDELNDYKGEFAIQSFNPYSMEYIRTHREQILRGQLATCIERTNKNYSKSEIKNFNKLKMLKISKPNFLCFDAKYLPNKKVNKLRQKGMVVLAYNINSNQQYLDHKDDCDNIIFENFLPD